MKSSVEKIIIKKNYTNNLHKAVKLMHAGIHAGTLEWTDRLSSAIYNFAKPNRHDNSLGELQTQDVPVHKKSL